MTKIKLKVEIKSEEELKLYCKFYKLNEKYYRSILLDYQFRHKFDFDVFYMIPMENLHPNVISDGESHSHCAGPNRCKICSSTTCNQFVKVISINSLIFLHA